jgi:hypothetical protein
MGNFLCDDSSQQYIEQPSNALSESVDNIPGAQRWSKPVLTHDAEQQIYSDEVLLGLTAIHYD